MTGIDWAVSARLAEAAGHLNAAFRDAEKSRAAADRAQTAAAAAANLLVTGDASTAASADHSPAPSLDSARKEIQQAVGAASHAAAAATRAAACIERVRAPIVVVSEGTKKEEEVPAQ